MSLIANRHNAHKLLMKLIFCIRFNLRNRGKKHRLDFLPPRFRSICTYLTDPKASAIAFDNDF